MSPHRRHPAWATISGDPTWRLSCDESRDIVLITGGNSGISCVRPRTRARAGWHVVIASRDRPASEEAIRRITSESGAGAASEMGLDLGSTTSVRALAREIQAGHVGLRALVCNAGLQVTTGPRLSADGYEVTFAVNHLVHFLLTNLLFQQLVANGPARIVVVASGVHDPTLWTGMPKANITDVRPRGDCAARREFNAGSPT